MPGNDYAKRGNSSFGRGLPGCVACPSRLQSPGCLNCLCGDRDVRTPSLAPGAPTSPERTALIDTFRKQSEGLQKKFEARIHKSDLTMPYRLFRPEAPGKLPLVLYLHGSGGAGDDNEKQLGLGNIFGTRVWLLPENQNRFPCYVVAPQSATGWVRYDESQIEGRSKPRGLP